MADRFDEMAREFHLPKSKYPDMDWNDESVDAMYAYCLANLLRRVADEEIGACMHIVYKYGGPTFMIDAIAARRKEIGK